MKIAIVTGASSGMGREFVTQLDKGEKFDEIWVIARRRERLEALAKECSAGIRPLALDLQKPESFDSITRLLAEEKPNVAVLVNAGGFGRFGSFTNLNLPEQEDMVDLNIKALMRMTYLALPYMASGGRIYQIDSLSAFQPVPYLNVYAATKAFVLSFSRALGVELRAKRIRVMAVCPGWVKTEFFNRAKAPTADSGSNSNDTITYFNRYFESEEVVARAIRDMKKRKDVSVCGASIRLQVFLTKLLPHRIIMRIWCKQQKK